MEYAMKVAPFLLNRIWNYARTTRPVNKVLTALKDYLGIDLNDDMNGYNKFNYNGSFIRNVSWQDID